jgi:hypothetical protein
LQLYDLISFRIAPDIVGQIVGMQLVGDYIQYVVKYREGDSFVSAPFDAKELEALSDEKARELQDMRVIGFASPE